MEIFRPKRSPTTREAPYNPFTSDGPPNETTYEREQRLQSLQEAQRVSRKIDADIAESRKAFEKKQKAIKILLLGQAESGKSTVLKNFQLAFTPSHFRAERAVWRIVIQLNLIGSVKRILEALQDEWGPGYSSPPPGRPSPVSALHRRLRMSLSPLLSVESSLSRLFSETQRASQSTEVTVRAGSRWKSLLTARSSTEIEPALVSDTRPLRNDPTGVLAACRQDIITLWEDAAVRNVLARRGIALETSAGFFLNDTERIATYNYDPTDADILRARVRTMGVEEHHFIMETTDVGSEYYIFDVGGSRSMRPQWIPYFDNMHAILFLAPLAFNQVLEEDPRVNRLEDSLCLWREICCSPLLAQATIILFLNKMDVLAATVAAGVDVKLYVPSYNGAPNDVMGITKYFREKFRAYHKRLSPRPRPFMCYETSAIDKHSTFPILDGVRESILRSALEKMAVI